MIRCLMCCSSAPTSAPKPSTTPTRSPTLGQLDGSRSSTEFSSDARADSLILASLNIDEDTIKLVSIERATGVPILLDEYEDEYDWITHTFRYGGARLTMDTVETCFGVQGGPLCALQLQLLRADRRRRRRVSTSN